MSVACQGDTTSGGGNILEGDPSFVVDGLPVAYEGARVLCHVHGLTHIAEATMPAFVGDRQVAREGDRLACGHHIVVQEWRRAEGVRYIKDNGYTQSMQAGESSTAPTTRSEAQASRGTVPLESECDHFIELRLLCQRGCEHEGLGYIKTFGAMAGKVATTDTRGVTVALACPPGRSVLVGVAIPDMEII
jgi:uncharacterized Zn-binding protein involved in type VI secretion